MLCPEAVLARVSPALLPAECVAKTGGRPEAVHGTGHGDGAHGQGVPTFSLGHQGHQSTFQGPGPAPGRLHLVQELGKLVKKEGW